MSASRRLQAIEPNWKARFLRGLIPSKRHKHHRTKLQATVRRLCIRLKRNKPPKNYSNAPLNRWSTKQLYHCLFELYAECILMEHYPASYAAMHGLEPQEVTT